MIYGVSSGYGYVHPQNTTFLQPEERCPGCRTEDGPLVSSALTIQQFPGGPILQHGASVLCIFKRFLPVVLCTLLLVWLLYQNRGDYTEVLDCDDDLFVPAFLCTLISSFRMVRPGATSRRHRSLCPGSFGAAGKHTAEMFATYT